MDTTDLTVLTGTDLVPIAADRTLDEIADSIRSHYETGVRETYFAIGRDLLEARAQFPGDREFGHWVSTNVSEEVLRRLGQGYLITPGVVDNLLLKGRVMSALERRGLDQAQEAVAWKRLESALGELGFDMAEDVRAMVSALYGGGAAPRPGSGE